MDKIKSYVIKHLSFELREVENSLRKDRIKHLNEFEKALIYKYSDDGYEALNSELRNTKGKNTTEFGLHLEATLNKLGNYEGLVYRSANLNKSEIAAYKNSMQKNITYTEYSFISSSKSRLIAMQYNGNILFRIVSKTGKEIEEISKFGSDSQNEREVIFSPNSNFSVLSVTKEGNYTLITMEEV